MFCKFGDGHGAGHHRTRLMVGKTITEDECAKLVKLTKPNAKGVTYVKSDKSCWAEYQNNFKRTSYFKNYGQTLVRKDDKRYCIFKGIFILNVSK